MQSYEVEIKSLLGSPERAEEVRSAMLVVDSGVTLLTRNTQLNHYFEAKHSGGSLQRLAEAAKEHLSAEAQEKLADLASKAKESSVRTRDKDGQVILVVKVSIGDDTSANGVSRMEFEETVPMTLDELDKIVLSAGYEYQAKWSREREEYLCKGVNVTLDRNAGYGWLAEFERVVDDQSKVASAEAEVRMLMSELGVEELPQERLARMFDFYNTHWPEYYGSEKIFVIE